MQLGLSTHKPVLRLANVLKGLQKCVKTLYVEVWLLAHSPQTHRTCRQLQTQVFLESEIHLQNVPRFQDFCTLLNTRPPNIDHIIEDLKYF